MAKKKNIRFKLLKSDFVSNVLKNKNFLFTQSAVEHFEDDKLFFSNVQNYINQQEKPFLQIHLAPSSYCLWKYLMHGYRQYSFSTICKLYDILWKNEQFFSFSLGGKNCNYLQIKYITFPMVLGLKDKREKDFKTYKIDLEKAIKKDLKVLDPKNGSFYALVIFSNKNVPKTLFK